MQEEWKPVHGYEDSYEVSTLGQVRSIPRRDNLGRQVGGRIRKTASHPRTGHKYVTLSEDTVRRNAKVHHLVLEAFDKPKPSGLVCRHLNGDPADNRIENLTWGTASENWDDMKRHGTTPAHTRPSLEVKEATPQKAYRAARNVHKLDPTKTSVTGVRGVSLCRATGKWAVSVKAGNKRHWGGRHSSFEDAVRVAKSIKSRLSLELTQQAQSSGVVYNSRGYVVNAQSAGEYARNGYAKE